MYGDEASASAANNNRNYSPSPSHHHHHNNHQQQQRSGGGLTRFSSAPTSFFQTLLDDDRDFAGFIASRSDHIQQPPPQQPFINHHHHQGSHVIKHEAQPPVDFGVSAASTNGGGLLRQTSSPADFFSSLFNDDDAVGFPSYRGNNTQAPHLSTNHPMPSIPEFQQHDHGINESLTGMFEKSDSYGECWHGNAAALVGQRRTGDSGNEISFGVPNEVGNQNGNGYAANASNGLIHQMSLPNTSSELAAMNKHLQFQESTTPCSNTRAKRGFATHPRSIAERVRRTKISDRMRKLQQLFPDIDKQTNTAQMLDMATDYIKDLEKEVQSLKDTREKCICLKR